ncbi:MAG: hypothetical protein E6Q59_09660 [Nitrosomonas sp.]|uniref:hypothetical protein n=1 Tax=Nitrosomonas sp. TaxID=42353 RepID=UPI0011D9A043|nr:hypothetical protein [Nitrosomonas sp.]MCG7756404.1 hypothetical protein [Nitrosomonas sp.]TXI36293.1 MAG: hypothetical protein E6Q59_09660 [Nitrosomonas sp.]UJP03858.1 MAG: hypothetical protein LZF85_05315 [Nitrosomonas sp.]UJP07552.1 MAG: hypothetical protein LZF84_00090 [Nitrosomonas sp.]
MDWMEIISALALIAFIIFLFPAAREMIKNNPQGTSSDWMSFVIPVIAIALFVTFLVMLV